MAAGSHILVSSLAVFELWYGVAKSAKQDFNRKRLEAFLAGPILMLPFEDADFRAAASLRASLESSGKPIGAYDVLMAAQTLRHELTLVTSNGSESRARKAFTGKTGASSRLRRSSCLGNVTVVVVVISVDPHIRAFTVQTLSLS